MSAAPAACRGDIRAFVDYLRDERNAAPATRTGYDRELRRFAAFLAGEGVADWADVTPDTVQRFVARGGFHVGEFRQVH